MTVLKQKYAQVSDGYWQSPTAVQVGFRLGCRPVELLFREVVSRPPSFCCSAVYLYSVQQCSYKHMHVGELQCVYSSAIFRTKSSI